MFWKLEEFLDNLGEKEDYSEELKDYAPSLLTNVELFASPPKPRKKSPDEFY